MTRREFIADSWRERLARAGLSDLRLLLDVRPPIGRLPGNWQPLSKPGLGGRERWRWELPDESQTVLYVKRYLHTPLREQIDRVRRQSARHSRAWWEYFQSAELTRKSVPAVRAVGAVEAMLGVLERCSVVLFEEVEGDAFERAWPAVARRCTPITRGVRRHAVTRRLARFISAFHQTGVCHRDLYLCHVFTQLDEDGRHPPRFTLIDLARMHAPRWRRTRWIVKDLSQMDCSARQTGATRSDRMRFLVAYLGLHPNAPRVRWYARRIVRKSDRILRRIARKGGRT